MNYLQILEKMIASNQFDKVTMAQGEIIREIKKGKVLQALEILTINKDYPIIDTAKGIQDWIKKKG